jgi:hypothetical protein
VDIKGVIQVLDKPLTAIQKAQPEMAIMATDNLLGRS